MFAFPCLSWASLLLNHNAKNIVIVLDYTCIYIEDYLKSYDDLSNK